MSGSASSVRKLAKPHKRYSIYALSAGSFCFDLFVVVGSAPAISLLLQASGLSEAPEELQHARLILGLFAGALYAMFSIYLGAYSAKDVLSARIVLPNILTALALTFGAFFLVGASLKITQNYSRIWFGSWMIFSMTVVLSTRSLHLRRIHNAMRNNASVFGAFSVGYQCAPFSAKRIAADTSGEVRVLGTLQIETLDQLRTVAQDVRAAGQIDQVYIRAPWRVAPELMAATDAFRALSAQIFVIPYDDAISKKAVRIGDLGGQMMMVAYDRPIEGWAIWWKRMQDIVLSLCIIILASPVLLVAACAIRLESRGPVIFKQKRIGLNGKVVDVWKFRSMFFDQTDADASQQTSKNDPRVTRVGRFIRANSIDELPQFFNVLQGQMSIVGPRPHAIKTSAAGRLLDEVVEEYAMRHRVKPGITGLAQVNGCRGELDTEEKLRMRVDYDLAYIENWSTFLDIKIVLRTILLVFRDPAAF